MSDAIDIVEACMAGGRHFAAGTCARIPDDISATDAWLLIRLGRARLLDRRASSAAADSPAADAEAPPRSRRSARA